MATPRQIRRLALQTLYQLDLRGSVDDDLIRAGLDDAEGFTPRDRRKAFDLASAAYSARKDSDEYFRALAPTWPAHRQPAIDRAILRLAHHEITSLKTHPVVVVNEAVELAREFSTEKSPAFVNGLLDHLVKAYAARFEQARPAAADSPAADSAAEDDTTTA